MTEQIQTAAEALIALIPQSEIKQQIRALVERSISKSAVQAHLDRHKALGAEIET